MPSESQVLEYLYSSMTTMEEASPTANIILYGESGVGKTKEAMEIAQAITPPDKKILFVDSHVGWQTLLNHPELQRRTVRIPWENVAQQQAIIQMIDKKAGRFADFETIVFDEYSSMAKKDLDKVVAARAGDNSGKSDDVGTQPDFYYNTERMRRLMEDMFNLNLNLIVVAHMRYDKDNRGVEREGPAFMPKLSTTLREMSSVVAKMTATQVTVNDEAIYERMLQVHPTARTIAKCRVGGKNGKSLPVMLPPDEFRPALVEWLNLKRGSDESDTVYDDLPVESPETDSGDENDDPGFTVQ